MQEIELAYTLADGFEYVKTWRLALTWTRCPR